MNLEFRVVHEKEEWSAILDKFEQKDIYFEYDYFDLYRCEGESPLLVYMETELGKVIYPFMYRDISYHPNFEGKISRGSYFDISSPYGYSGILIEAADKSSRPQLAELFYREFGQFCKDRNIVSEFIKFSPLLNNHVDFENIAETVCLKKMVVTNLQDYGDPIYGELKKRKRRSANKCRRMGMETVFEFAPKVFDEQLSVYYDTMERRDASDFYFFSKEYFQQMIDSLSDNILLASITLDGKVIGFELCFLYGDFIHSHIGGTSGEYLKYSPSDLLASEIISWGHKQGYKYYYAGGGLTSAEDDSLYLYKKAFAKNTEFNLYVGMNIWDSESYSYLNKLSSQDLQGEDSFFPLYRKPLSE